MVLLFCHLFFVALFWFFVVALFWGGFLLFFFKKGIRTLVSTELTVA